MEIDGFAGLERQEAYEIGRAESGGDGRLDVVLGDTHRFFSFSSPVCSGGATDWQARRRLLAHAGQAGRSSQAPFFGFEKLLLSTELPDYVVPPRALVARESNNWKISMVGKFL